MTQARIHLALLAWLALAALGHAQTAPPPLYRVFLTDGSTLASFGEWARVGDHLVFSLPLAPQAGPGELHLVSLPLHRIDWPRTERYADAVRATQYAATRGEADFAELSTTVAHTLNQVALITDPRERLATAERARRALTAWPGARYGYRAAEVREVVGVLDEVISSLRAAAGQGAFELSLSTSTPAPPDEPLLPPPDHEQVVLNLMTAATLVESPAEKTSLLQTVVAVIDRAVDYLPGAVASAFRATALGEIAEERRVDELYGELRTTTLADASRYAERADVRTLERLRERVSAFDLKLGGRRPDYVAGLLATLDVHLEGARRLRLAQDQWLLGEARMREYRRAALPFVQSLIGVRRSLEDIKLLAGPPPQQLRPLARQLNRKARQLALIEPPSHLAAVHAVFKSAFSLAENAVQLRRDAVEHADLNLARQGAAAASGALMLLERARADLNAALKPPIPARSSTRP